jgi:hypothetical protein
MDFCGNNDGQPFVSSVISSQGGGSDPTTRGWGALKINLSMSDVQDTIQEGRLVGTGIWDVDGNPMIPKNS